MNRVLHRRSCSYIFHVYQEKKTPPMTSFVVFAASPPYVSTCKKLNIPAHLHIWQFPHNLAKRAHGNATKPQRCRRRVLSTLRDMPKLSINMHQLAMIQTILHYSFPHALSGSSTEQPSRRCHSSQTENSFEVHAKEFGAANV